jgi:hypothetical protein
MMKLENNWFADGVVDFEYKKYMLLAYLQMVDKNFTSNKLYPYLAELVQHYNNLNDFVRNKNSASASFPKQITGLDLENFVISYEQNINDDRLMGEIMKILDFSLPAIKKHLEEGKEIYEWIESQLYLRQIGIMPLQWQYGYILIRNGSNSESSLYNYKLTIFESAEEKYRGIATQYVSNITSYSYFNIQASIMQTQNLLSPPPVYAIESEYCFPLGETLLPIAKRVLVKHLSINSQQ